MSSTSVKFNPGDENSTGGETYDGSLMKFIDDFNKRQKYYETIDLETGNKIKAFAHIRKDLYRTGKTMLEINSVTKGSLRILLMHLNIHLVVHLV